MEWAHDPDKAVRRKCAEYRLMLGTFPALGAEGREFESHRPDHHLPRRKRLSGFGWQG